MSEFYLGRQPIFDRDMEIAGYEMVYRTEASASSEDSAVGQHVLDTLTQVGLERLTGPHRAYLDLTPGLLNDPAAMTLPADRVVLEASVGLVPGERMLQGLSRLRQRGYTIALEAADPSSADPALLELCDILKVDVRPLGPAGIEAMVGSLRSLGPSLLALGVERQPQFEHCHELGFDLFQGLFLTRPHVVKGREVPASRMAAFRLLSRLQERNIQFAELQEIVAQDASLSYRLLRLLNSAYYSMPTPVESMRQALVLLGIQRLRAWASLFALASVDGKPAELLVLASVRAKMCEALAELSGESQTDRFFTVGLLSSLDAMFDVPLELVLESIPLASDIEAALLRQEGLLGRTLECVQSYERGDWAALDQLGIPAATLRQAYLESLTWATSACAELAGV